MTTKQYKQLKNLKKESLRDNMSNLELVLNMLAEVSTTKLSQEENPQGLEENIKVAKRGGKVAKSARKALEEESSTPVITSGNSKDLKKLKD